MRKFRYYSANWMMWYSEDAYDKLMNEIELLKSIYKRLVRSTGDEM